MRAGGRTRHGVRESEGERAAILEQRRRTAKRLAGLVRQVLGHATRADHVAEDEEEDVERDMEGRALERRVADERVAELRSPAGDRTRHVR